MKRTVWLFGTLVALLFASVMPATAQSGPGPAQNTSFQLRIGQYAPLGGGDLWDGNEATFTLYADDFSGFVFGTTVATAVGNNLEVGFNLDFYDETVRSSYRDYVDEDGYRIYHDTTLRVIPLTVDLRFMPAGRYRITQQGKRIPRAVWYLGIGAGMNFWDYEEVGDFIDFDHPDLPIYGARYRDDGVAFEAHALTGFELPVGRNFNVLLEARYSWSETSMSRDFAGFGTLNLDAASFYFGGAWRF